MAWKPITKCQQCKRTLTAKDRAMGTICTACVSGPRRIFDNSNDEEHTDDND